MYVGACVRVSVCEYVIVVVILVVVTLFSGVMLGVFDYLVLNKSYHKLSKNVISLCSFYIHRYLHGST